VKSRKSILEVLGNEADGTVVQPKMYDKIGQEITVGAIIVYGHALGRCAALQLGKVLALKTTMKPGHQWNPATKKHENCEVPEYRITVQGITETANWRNDYIEELTLLRKGTLQFPDRTIVLERSKVPQKIVELLDTVS
jgi:hypothetical protein